MEKLKVGIVGCGGIAMLRHIPAFSKLKDVRIAAVCDKNIDLANKAAGKYHVSGVYSDMAQMLAAEKLNIVDICTPPQSHALLAILAIENGCHVIMEKPMALTTADCDEMIAKAKQHNVKLCVIHNQLFYPPMEKALKMIKDGKIGKFIGMRIYMSDPSEEMIMKEDYWIHKLPGGLLGETGPHLVYNSMAFIGKVNNVDINARSFLEHPWAQFDEFRIELEGLNGNSSILVSYPSQRRASVIDILGTEGALQLDMISMITLHRRATKSMKPVELALYALNDASQIVGEVLNNAYRFLTKQVKIPHESVISGFVDSIIHDSQPPVTAEQGRETVNALGKIIATLHQKYGVYSPK